MTPDRPSTPYITLTAWATPRDLSERRQRGEPPVAKLHVVIPHGKGSRVVVVAVGLDECLALCANAADAARLLAQEASYAAR